MGKEKKIKKIIVCNKKNVSSRIRLKGGNVMWFCGVGGCSVFSLPLNNSGDEKAESSWSWTDPDNWW